MAYYSGSAADMAAVRSALVAACVAEDWSWDSGTDMLSKGVVYLRLQLASGFLRLTGRTSSSAGDAPHSVQMGPFTGWASNPLPDLIWPASYEIFVFEHEVYCVINYSVDCYQWCAFGLSSVGGLPGTGMWLGASAPGAYTGYREGLYINAAHGGGSYGHAVVCPALFWRGGYGVGYSTESLVHSDLDSNGWWWDTAYMGDPLGVRPLNPLVSILPNAWNSETVLLPIRAYKRRPESKISLTADLEHARYTRVDNYVPGEVITIGSDRWKVFPWYRKNAAARQGTGGYRGAHSGTLGWAIRYEGP